MKLIPFIIAFVGINGLVEAVATTDNRRCGISRPDPFQADLIYHNAHKIGG